MIARPLGLRYGLAALALLGLVLFLSVCSPLPPTPVIHRVAMRDGQIVDTSRSRLPPSAKAVVEQATHRPDPLSGTLIIPGPTVEQWLTRCHDQHGSPFCTELRDVVVTFRDTLALPRFPAPVIHEPPDSPANQRVLQVADSLGATIGGLRDEAMKALWLELGLPSPCEIFWVANAALLRMSIDDIQLLLTQLGAQDHILFIEARFADDPSVQPHGAVSVAFPNPAVLQPAPEPLQGFVTVRDGRRFIGSDPYFRLDSLHGMRGWIGLLDTGMLFDHVLLNDTLGQPTHIRNRDDCVNGDSSCERHEVARVCPRPAREYNPSTCAYHGTASGAIITANLNGSVLPATLHDGEALRGITNHVLDFYKVWVCRANTLTTDTAAILRGFQKALVSLDKVILVETQLTDSRFFGVVSTAVTNVFEMGAAVIAPAGDNFTPVEGPAYATRAVGVGALNLSLTSGGHISATQYSLQSRGPTQDGRVKPDVQGPTQTLTATAACRNPITGPCSETGLAPFQFTSGSAPYVTAAASLLRNWLVLTGGDLDVDPGQIYAQLVLAGQDPYPFDSTSGAGAIRLPPLDGLAWWGQVEVGSGEVIDVPLDLGSETPDTLDGALWWPDPVSPLTRSRAPIVGTSGAITGFFAAPSNDVDLYLLDPSGAMRGASKTTTGVFERARVLVGSESEGTGTWTLRIIGANIPQAPQTVYWTARARLRKGS